MLRQGKAFALGAVLVALALAWAPAANADADAACTGDGVAASDATRAQVELSLLCLINRYRGDNGLKPLYNDTRLSTAALAHSADMNSAGYFDHDNPGNPLDTPDTRALAQGYPFAVGENLVSNGAGGPLAGIGTAYSLFDEWRHSPPHNENILTADYIASGLGVDPGCWCGGSNFTFGGTGTQMFGVGPANTGETALSLNFGAIPGSAPGSSDDSAGKKKCKKGKKGKKKKKKCRKKKKRHGKKR